MFKPVSSTETFPEMERRWLAHWYESGIIKKYLLKNSTSDKYFSFIDGPITANNPMGVHHAWGRTYKDLWQKFFNLKGYQERFQNGFDCQGLWVEVEVEKELGLKTKKDIENLVPGNPFESVAKFVALCKERVMKFSGIQTEQSKRLGYFMDWEHSYYTMSAENNYMIWHFLKVCHDNGWIYKGFESVPWCPRCETAISQHEMLTEDYKEISHESVYMRLPIVGENNTYLLVWTTTPWTIPANIAVAVDKEIEYSLVKQDDRLYWLAKDLVNGIFGADAEVVKTVIGTELVGKKYKGAFDELPAVKKAAENPLFHTVVETDPQIMPITTTEGTGMVHTAVSAGTEDFLLGKKLGLPMIPVIADNAQYLDGFNELSGKNAKKHPELIIDFLKTHENGTYLFKTMMYKHRYPACWRCKTELVWKVAEEWYIAMDKPVENSASQDSRTLRERMMDVAKKITWMPEFGLDRELDWLKNMHDWLISKKNRYWGLALPIYICTKCHEFDVVGSYDELKKRAVGGWDAFEGHTPHKPYIDSVQISCTHCSGVMERINDVGNPWLDAGIVPFSTIAENNEGNPLYTADRNQWEKWFPADFITESFPGQFKNWFYALIAMSTVLENTNPFKRVLGFGTQLAEDGRPMHKSWGNAIEFNEGADKIGVDVMRWMFARANPADNLLFGYTKADEVRRQFYLLLWNIYKFFIEYANLDKPELQKEQKFENVLDRWIMSRLAQVEKTVDSELSQFSAASAVSAVESFVNDLSTWYLRRSRDRVWMSAKDETDKFAFYHTMHTVLVRLSVIISPFMPFISEEMYTNLTGNESVHLSAWPEAEYAVDESLNADMSVVRMIAEVGHRVRKEGKLKVRQPLAKAMVVLPKEYTFKKQDAVESYLQLLKDELNVKGVEVTEGGESITVSYDTVLTDELLLEGELRDLIRSIQNERKVKGIKVSDEVVITVPEKFKPFEEQIKKKVLARSISYGAELKVE